MLLLRVLYSKLGRQGPPTQVTGEPRMNIVWKRINSQTMAGNPGDSAVHSPSHPGSDLSESFRNSDAAHSPLTGPIPPASRGSGLGSSLGLQGVDCLLLPRDLTDLTGQFYQSWEANSALSEGPWLEGARTAPSSGPCLGFQSWPKSR